MAIDLRGPLLSMKHEIEIMLRHGGGAIVNTAGEQYGGGGST